jgi:glycosyltransferase involved in cell wall biosynthesis
LYILPHPHFFVQTGGIGGAVTHARGVLEAFARLGFECHVICPDTFGALSIPGARLYEISGVRDIARLRWSLKLMRALESVTRSNHFEFVYMRYVTGFAPFMPRLRKLMPETPICLELNSFRTNSHSPFRFLEDNAVSVADLIVTVSEPVKEDVIDRCSRGIADRVIVVPNGVDPVRFRSMSSTDQRVGPGIHMAYVGTLQDHGGLECLIEAVKHVVASGRNVFLSIVGDGPAREGLERLAGSVKEIEFTGSIPYESVPGFLQSCDILVYTTRVKFGSPTKLLEYMASGRATIAARTGPVSWLLGDGALGALFTMGDAKDLAARIIELYNDPERRRRLGAAAREEVYRAHTWDHRIAQILSALSASRRGALHMQGVEG